MAQQEKVMGSVCSLTQQRRQVLPNPGGLENLTPTEAPHPLELIPGAENRSKNPIILNLSDHYKKTHDPEMNIEKNRTIPTGGPLIGVHKG